ncbi:MAG TPA: hypothetical protein DER09_15555 [Prolixibacteraceae bacterium]|nr:hypothetical protein [Prolixibacteraceae bacterium]
MKNGKIWLILFLILLLINIVVGSVFIASNNNEKSLQKERQIENLNNELNQRTIEYVENAKQLKYLLETILDNSDELKKYMPEYEDVDTKTFEEKLRQKVVRLNILIDDLEKK